MISPDMSLFKNEFIYIIVSDSLYKQKLNFLK